LSERASNIKSVCIGIISPSSPCAFSGSVRFFNHSDATGFDIKPVQKNQLQSVLDDDKLAPHSTNWRCV